MSDKVVRRTLLRAIGPRLGRLGMTEADVTDDLDLLRSGLLDSLGFVDLVVAVEEEVGQQVDLISAMDRPGGTTVGGLIRLFEQRP